MRQIIGFEKNIEKNILTIIESSEVDNGVILELHTEDYNLDDMIKASSQGLLAFTKAMRRRSFFPASGLCEKLFTDTMDFFEDKDQQTKSIEYIDIFPVEELGPEDEEIEIDAILEEDEVDDAKLKEIDDDMDEPLKFTPDDTSEHEN